MDFPLELDPTLTEQGISFGTYVDSEAVPFTGSAITVEYGRSYSLSTTSTNHTLTIGGGPDAETYFLYQNDIVPATNGILQLVYPDGWDGDVSGTVLSSAQFTLKGLPTPVDSEQADTDNNQAVNDYPEMADDNLDDLLNDAEGNDPEENVPALEAVAAFILRLF